jgi:RNAse (barnase) inhibitor barstar
VATPDELAARGYQIVRIDAAAPESEREFLDAIGVALDFPDYYGHNLDALNDCMRDVVRQDYGWRPDTAGLAIVFTGYPAATARWPHAAKATLEIMARASRDAAQSGKELLCLTD